MGCFWGQVYRQTGELIMNEEQIVKKLEWLDDERRKDKNTIAALQDKVTSLEGLLNNLEQQNKEYASEISALQILLGRIDDFDKDIVQHRSEVSRKIENLQKQNEKQQKDTVKQFKSEINNVNKNIEEVQKELSQLTEIRRELVIREEGEKRLSKMITEIRNENEELQRSDDELRRMYRLIEDGRRQDIKRITDLQGEVIALRKQADRQRGRIELLDVNHKKVEIRLNELVATENERKLAQAAFLEKQAYAEAERENLWKSWQKRFESIEKQALEIDEQIRAFDVTHRAIQQAQASVDELSQKIERRLNEVMEIQRLGEERMRQEWVAFRADDQKRWANYVLSQDEQRGEINRMMESTVERIVLLEDQVQEMQDAISLLVEQTQKRINALLAIYQEWSSIFDES